MENYIKDYTVFLEIEKGLSENTVSNYVRDIEKFFLYCAKLKKDPKDFNLQELEGYCLERSKSGLKAKSLARLISSLKSFYNYLLVRGTIEDSPTDLLQGPKFEKRLPDTISLEEINTIIGTIDLSKKQGFRNKVILELLYGAGLRVSELIEVKINNLNLEDGYIKVLGKGNKERLIPLPIQTQKILEVYLKERKKEEAEAGFEDLLFLNKHGRRISRVMIFLIIKEAVELAGIHKNISPHTFRHSFASHLIEGGANIRAVQELMGHESIMSTEIYTHVDDQYLRSTLIEYHPWSIRK